MVDQAEKEHMSDQKTAPTLLFFRAHPRDLLAQPPLASSLQSFETCLLLIAMGRLPAALVSCGSAWESAIKAALTIPPSDHIRAHELIKRARGEHVQIAAFDADAVRKFSKMRNQVAHFGFSPKDDDECAVLLLTTGFPFLELLYRELFDFHLDWKAAHPNAPNFQALAPGETERIGLVPDVADQIRLAAQVYSRARIEALRHYGYCLRGLSRSVSLWIGPTFTSDAVDKAIEKASEQVFDEEMAAKELLSRSFDEPLWENFFCPICHRLGFVAELNCEKLHAGAISTGRCCCIHCNFFARQDDLHLSEVYLEPQFPVAAPEIFREFGITAPTTSDSD